MARLSDGLPQITRDACEGFNQCVDGLVMRQLMQQGQLAGLTNLATPTGEASRATDKVANVNNGQDAGRDGVQIT